MSDLVAALLLGLIEGLTEFLPISSTGHLLIAQQWLGARSDFFNIVIQAGAILAIVLVFRQRIWMLASGMRQPENRDYSMKVMLAFFTTALVGLPVRMAGWELPDELAPVAWALVLGGVWMLLAEYWAGRRGHCEQVSWSMAVGVGLAQVAAGVFPGTSRSAAAIFLVMLMGLARRSAAEFVFLVGIPTMFAASGYAFAELWFKQGIGAEPWGEVALAFLAATGTGFIVVHWLLGYIKAHPFTGFAIYRIVLGLALLIGLTLGR